MVLLLKMLKLALIPQIQFMVVFLGILTFLEQKLRLIILLSETVVLELILDHLDIVDHGFRGKTIAISSIQQLIIAMWE